jgi:hypothetical protein
VGERICSVCCGSKRLVELDCPPDCGWLPGADRAWQGRQTEQRRDAQLLYPALGTLTRIQGALFGWFTEGVVKLRRERRDLDDALLLVALEALQKTAATAESGILYEHRPEDLRAESLIRELGVLLEPRGPEGEPLPVGDEDRSAVLASLVRALRSARAESEAPTAFLDTLTRLEARRLGGSGAKAPSRLVQP